WGDVQIEVELADVIEIIGIDGFIAGVEGIDDAGPDGTLAAIFATDDFDVGELVGEFLENGRRGVGGAVIDDDPEGRGNGLFRDAVERAAREVGFVAAGWRV